MAQVVNEAYISGMLESILKAIHDNNKTFLAQPMVGDRKELYAALAAAQSEFKLARTLKENHYLRSQYEDLAEVVMASRPYLSKNGLSVMFQVLSTDDGGTILSCSLLHSSGQSIESKVRLMPLKGDPKSFQSEMAFMKRVLYSGITGVVAQDEDDDADMAMSGFREAESKPVVLSAKIDPREDRIPITKEQYDELEYELAEHPDITQKILDGLHLRDLASMPKAKYHEAIKRVRYIKDARTNKRP